MKKELMIILAAFVFLLTPGCSQAQKASPEEQFKKSFSQLKYETFAPTSVKGVYEVYDGQRALYYLADGDVLIIGNMFTKEGKNLTQESNAKRMSAKMTNLPLDKALKIGNGKTAVVEFIDPNCHYCRLSYKYFSERKKDVTLYVFFYPLSEESEKKIRHILCAKDKAQAYEDALSGKLDGNPQLNLCNDQAAMNLLQSHQQLNATVGVRATPLFYIKGQVIPGFDQPAIEKLLAN